MIYGTYGTYGMVYAICSYRFNGRSRKFHRRGMARPSQRSQRPSWPMIPPRSRSNHHHSDPLPVEDPGWHWWHRAAASSRKKNRNRFFRWRMPGKEILKEHESIIIHRFREGHIPLAGWVWSQKTHLGDGRGKNHPALYYSACNSILQRRFTQRDWRNWNCQLPTSSNTFNAMQLFSRHLPTGASEWQPSITWSTEPFSKILRSRQTGQVIPPIFSLIQRILHLATELSKMLQKEAVRSQAFLFDDFDVLQETFSSPPYTCSRAESHEGLKSPSLVVSPHPKTCQPLGFIIPIRTFKTCLKLEPMGPMR